MSWKLLKIFNHAGSSSKKQNGVRKIPSKTTRCLFLYISQQQSLFGKVEPNLASTPSLECLRRKLLEESLIWLSTWTTLSRSRAGAKVYFSDIVLKNFNHAGFSTDKMASTKNPVKNNFSSLPLLRSKIVKVSLVDGFTGMSWLSTWTILSRSRCPGRGKDLFFKHSVEKLQPRWFFVRKTKWRPKNPVKKQLLQFTAPKAKNRQSFAGGRPPGVFIEA